MSSSATGGLLVQNYNTFLQRGLNGADIADPGTFRTNLGVTGQTAGVLTFANGLSGGSWTSSGAGTVSVNASTNGTSLNVGTGYVAQYDTGGNLNSVNTTHTGNLTVMGASTLQGFTTFGGSINIGGNMTVSTASTFAGTVSCIQPVFFSNGISGTSNLVLTPTSGTPANTITFTPTSVIPSIDNTFVLGSSTKRYTALYAATGTIQTSDSKLKIATPLLYGLKELKQMNTIQYSWKDGDPTEQFFGFCAEQLVPLMPELVYTGDVHQLNYSEVIPVVVNAVKELATEVLEGCNRVKELSGQVKDLTMIVALQKQQLIASEAEFGYLVNELENKHKKMISKMKGDVDELKDKLSAVETMRNELMAFKAEIAILSMNRVEALKNAFEPSTVTLVSPAPAPLRTVGRLNPIIKKK